MAKINEILVAGLLKLTSMLNEAIGSSPAITIVEYPTVSRVGICLWSAISQAAVKSSQPSQVEQSEVEIEKFSAE